MFKAQSELLQLTELYTPLGEVLSPSDTSVRPVGQRVDPERKAHNSRYENALQRGNEPFRQLLQKLNITHRSLGPKG